MARRYGRSLAGREYRYGVRSLPRSRALERFSLYGRGSLRADSPPKTASDRLGRGASVTRRSGRLVNLPRMSYREQLRVLEHSLGTIYPGLSCGWPVAKVYNTILEHVKVENPSCPLIAAMDPLARSSNASVSTSSVGTV